MRQFKHIIKSKRRKSQEPQLVAESDRRCRKETYYLQLATGAGPFAVESDSVSKW